LSMFSLNSTKSMLVEHVSLNSTKSMIIEHV